jgi:hypothetical protein
MMRATAKASPTGIRGLRRSLTKPPPGKPLKLVILSVAAVIRADRIYHEGVETVEALTAGAVAGNPPPSWVVVIALLEEASGAAKQGNRATAAVRAVRACLREEAVVPEAEDPVVAGLVVAAVVVAAAVAAVAAVVVGSRR